MNTITRDSGVRIAGARATTLGALCFVAGILGAASGLFLALIDPAVPDDRFSYPLAAGAFAAIQVWFFVQHLGLAAGSFGAWRVGVFGSSRSGRVGYWLGLIGMLLLAVTELIAIAASQERYPSPETAPLDVLYGVSSVAIGIGWIVGGIAVIRSGRWSGWRSKVPLAIGVYVFVPMLPAMAAGFLPARLGITGWMLLFAALGLAIARRDDPRIETPSHTG